MPGGTGPRYPIGQKHVACRTHLRGRGGPGSPGAAVTTWERVRAPPSDDVEHGEAMWVCLEGKGRERLTDTPPNSYTSSDAALARPVIAAPRAAITPRDRTERRVHGSSATDEATHLG